LGEARKEHLLVTFYGSGIKGNAAQAERKNLQLKPIGSNKYTLKTKENDPNPPPP